MNSKSTNEGGIEGIYAGREKRETEPKIVLAFDVGATNIRASVVQVGKEGADILSREQAQTPIGDASKLLALLVQMSSKLKLAAQKNGLTPVAVGVAFAGHFSVIEPGYLTFAGNMGLHQVNLQDPLEQELRVPTHFINDVSAAAYAEAHDRKIESLATIFVGTGIGLGFIKDGQIVENTGDDSALTVVRGHNIFKSGGAPCPLGCDGCFQSYLGGKALGLRAQAAGVASDADGLLKAWRAGDQQARIIIEEAFDAMRALVKRIEVEFKPEKIAIGGTVIKNFPELMVVASEVATVSESKVGDDAPLIGAALIGAGL
ncbi:MAG: ROK family protein [Candidatus Magasanikbacteria bacterium]|nr:ROK family protein [Candidatus Magasanikbacteria bacterium]